MIEKYKHVSYRKIKAIQWTGDNTNEIINFGTVYCENKNESKNFIFECPFPSLKRKELWIFDCFGGDILYLNDYIAREIDYFYPIKKTELEKNWRKIEDSISGTIYENINGNIFYAVKWTGDNFEEIKQFTNNNLHLINYNHILIKNTCGRSDCNIGDFVICENSFFFSLPEKNFKENYYKIGE